MKNLWIKGNLKRFGFRIYRLRVGINEGKHILFIGWVSRGWADGLFFIDDDPYSWRFDYPRK
jgi:hypothetical protein